MEGGDEMKCNVEMRDSKVVITVEGECDLDSSDEHYLRGFADGKASVPGASERNLQDMAESYQGKLEWLREQVATAAMRKGKGDDDETLVTALFARIVELVDTVEETTKKYQPDRVLRIVREAFVEGWNCEAGAPVSATADEAWDKSEALQRYRSGWRLSVMEREASEHASDRDLKKFDRQLEIIVVLRKENEGLRKAIGAAYYEGWHDKSCQKLPTSDVGWAESNARKESRMGLGE